MKKATNLISFQILMMVLVGCSKETVHIDFPFEVGDVENQESLYRKVTLIKRDVAKMRHTNKALTVASKHKAD